MTKKVLLSSWSRYGLYVLFESFATSLPQVFSSTCLSTSSDVWHRWRGHPSPHILHFLVKNKKVSFMSNQFNFNCPMCSLGIVDVGNNLISNTILTLMPNRLTLVSNNVIAIVEVAKTCSTKWKKEILQLYHPIQFSIGLNKKVSIGSSIYWAVLN